MYPEGEAKRLSKLLTLLCNVSVLLFFMRMKETQQNRRNIVFSKPNVAEQYAFFLSVTSLPWFLKVSHRWNKRA